MEALMAMGTALFVIIGAVAVFMIVTYWFLFEKAGEPGWAAIVPVYNFLIILKIAGKPWWWIFGLLLSIIPFVGIILYIVWIVLILHGLSKNFGKDAGFTVGLVLLGIVFLPILAFGDAQYQPLSSEAAAAGDTLDAGVVEEAASAPEEPKEE